MWHMKQAYHGSSCLRCDCLQGYCHAWLPDDLIDGHAAPELFQIAAIPDQIHRILKEMIELSADGVRLHAFFEWKSLQNPSNDTVWQVKDALIAWVTGRLWVSLHAD